MLEGLNGLTLGTSRFVGSQLYFSPFLATRLTPDSSPVVFMLRGTGARGVIAVPRASRNMKTTGEESGVNRLARKGEKYN